MVWLLFKIPLIALLWRCPCLFHCPYWYLLRTTTTNNISSTPPTPTTPVPLCESASLVPELGPESGTPWHWVSLSLQGLLFCPPLAHACRNSTTTKCSSNHGNCRNLVVMVTQPQGSKACLLFWIKLDWHVLDGGMNEGLKRKYQSSLLSLPPFFLPLPTTILRKCSLQVSSKIHAPQEKGEFFTSNSDLSYFWSHTALCLCNEAMTLDWELYLIWWSWLGLKHSPREHLKKHVDDYWTVSNGQLCGSDLFLWLKTFIHTLKQVEQWA